MENILFKKSYLLSNFKEIKYDDLWNKKGIFTTIRVIGRPYRLYLLDQHLKNLNYSLKKYGINASLSKRKICKIINNLFNKKTNKRLRPLQLQIYLKTFRLRKEKHSLLKVAELLRQQNNKNKQ